MAGLHGSSHVEEIPCFSEFSVVASNDWKDDAWSRERVYDVVKIVCDIVAGYYASSFEPLHKLVTEN